MAEFRSFMIDDTHELYDHCISERCSRGDSFCEYASLEIFSTSMALLARRL